MKKVGRYEIISELGRGAMGIVYKASDPTIDREVALKVLSLNTSQEHGTNSPQEMFMREVRAAGRLAHPSIVTIYDAFDDKETQASCIVMELVPGKTLEKILDSGPPLAPEQNLSVIRQVVEGLDYAHRHNVIHRDLKPANILVTDDGRAKITDFGIAKVLAREGVARTIGIMGTPSFMSPEQVKGGEIDARTDIFSLGIMIFTMLAGTKPFSGNTAAVMFKIVYEEPPLPTSVNPQLTPAHDQLVKKCLAKDRNHRYSSARELLLDLDDLQAGRPLRSHAGAPAPPAPRVMAPQERTLSMPVPSLDKPTAAPLTTTLPSTPSSPVMPPEVPRPRPIPRPLGSVPPRVQPPAPVVPPVTPRPAPPPPESHPVAGKTLVMRVPDLSEASRAPAPPQPLSTPPTPVSSPVVERTLRMQVPDLSGVSAPRPWSPPATVAPPPLITGIDRTSPSEAPDVSFASSSAQGEMPTEAGLSTTVIEGEIPPGEVTAAPKSKLIPIVVGILVVVLVASGFGIYWSVHHATPAPVAPPPVTVETQSAPPVPVAAPVETLAPAMPTPVEQPPAAVVATPEVTKKVVVHKPKAAVAPQPAPVTPPPEPQPQPAISTPAPQPVPAAPSPADIAKAEAAKLTNSPRIIQVACNYGLKEATFVFSAGSKALFEETLKGKKIKGGFLGIKGSYQGTFTHTITVPAGIAALTVRVVSKDGSVDLTKPIKMPPVGGFVPTMTVDVDNDHLALNWKNSAPAQ